MEGCDNPFYAGGELASDLEFVYNIGLLVKPNRSSSPLRGLVLGGILGLALASRQRGLCEAQATLFFPHSLILSTTDSRESTPAPLQDAKTTGDPVDWAQEVLNSKDAINALCKRIERIETQRKSEALRSACLLPEDKRIRIETLPGSFVRLSVQAEDSRIALLLCEGLLAYLTFKTKVPLENPDRENLSASEQKLRLQEKALLPAFWRMLGYDSPKAGTPDGGLYLDLQEYQTVVAQYRREMRDHFFRETRTAASGPSVVVLEPPSVAAQGRPWVSYPLIGAGLGFLAGVISRQRRNHRSLHANVPWRVQEREPSDRSVRAEEE